MIAANTCFLFRDRPFLERIVLAGTHGFDAVEFHREAQDEKVEDAAAAWSTYRDGLIYACAAAPDLTILIEPISATARPGYLLRTVAQAASVVSFVGRENLRIMFDVYHVAQEGCDIERTFADYAGLIGHIQIPDPVTRHEPSTGLLRDIRRMGWAGPIGAEYVPAGHVQDGLGWMQAT